MVSIQKAGHHSLRPIFHALLLGMVAASGVCSCVNQLLFAWPSIHAKNILFLANLLVRQLQEVLHSV